MTDADAVRRIALALPRTHEQLVGGRWKLKVRHIVFVAFSADERAMGFGFPREERESLVASDREIFFLPPPRDLRYAWVCARLAPLAEEEMRELVVDAWRMCVPRMLHDLPELPAPTAQLWHLLEQRAWDAARPLLHPQVRWDDAGIRLRGRNKVLAHLGDRPAPRPPDEVEVLDGRVRRWVRG
ncbi:MAG TPA: MmcQ/YjbR family DNA-binding protein [Marmoricola sp.]|nr:MmcQ/YjbR family DNA-binding protein [Marmoricola sp.]